MVLGADEVVRFLEAVPSLKARAALTTAYAAGLPASEAAGIKVADIDSSCMVIRVEQGHRVAIANSRLTCLHDGQVRFTRKSRLMMTGSLFAIRLLGISSTAHSCLRVTV